MPQIRIGVSGWTYAPWRGNFYPSGLKQKLELAYASRRFNALEVNGTFYSLQRPSSFQDWHAQTPRNFMFAIKGPRYLTHMRKLKEPRQPLANFLASGLLHLREKMGPILWQFPSFLPFKEDRFKAFFAMLPRDTIELSRLARRHDSFLKGRVHVEADERRPVRHAVEFRHESFLTDRFMDLLREHGMAMVIADVASRFPTSQEVTSNWVYVRLHGSRRLYVSGYTPREIKAWAVKVQKWHSGAEPASARSSRNKPAGKRPRDVYVFFDNTDVKLRAPVDARRLAEELGAGPEETPRSIVTAIDGAVSSASRRAPARRKK